MTLESISPSLSVRKVFELEFGTPPELIRTAPGRVNLIGEHTDYNDGFVLPIAINYHVAIAAKPTNDRIITAIAVNQGNSKIAINLDEPAMFDENASWSNYLRGVIQELQKKSYRLSGANLVISGNVPLGAGLSSSAALEIAIIKTFTDLNNEHLDGQTAALIGQTTENDFCGCNCGIMDQLVSALGQKNHAILLDCRTLETQTVKIPDHTSLIVINSNVQRGLVDSEYNHRREQCEAVAQFFGVAALRDITLARLKGSKHLINETEYRRAYHVISENYRTLDAATSLESDDLKSLGRLMEKSHLSMKNDFEITTPEIDGLVEIVKSAIGEQGGVRMTGGGFGGCVVVLVPSSLENKVYDAVEKHYFDFSGRTPEIYTCYASDGAFTEAKT